MNDYLIKYLDFFLVLDVLIDISVNKIPALAASATLADIHRISFVFALLFFFFINITINFTFFLYGLRGNFFRRSSNHMFKGKGVQSEIPCKNNAVSCEKTSKLERILIDNNSPCISSVKNVLATGNPLDFIIQT